MARRLSPWQQFAANFDSTYGTFNTMFSDIEEGQIMRDEVTELQSGIGPGPRSQQLWSYGGKTYDKEITPEMLTGLRNQRLIDNMAKWGDTEGAMKLQLDQANLRQMENQALLDEGTLKDRIANQGLQNDALLASIGLTEQQIAESKTLLPHKQTEYILNAIRKRSDNRVAIGTEESRIAESGSVADSAKSQAEIDAITAEELDATSHLRVKATKSDYLQIIDDNKAKKLENRVSIDASKQKIAVNEVMKTFRDMAKRNEFADDQAAQDWLVDNIGNIDRDLALDMRDNYNAHQVAAITHQSTMFKTSAMAAYASGGVEGLSTAIDNLNGVNDTFVEYHDKNENKVTIWAIDPKTKKRLNKIVSGTLGEGGDFDMNLQKVLDPASSMAISKSYHDELLVQAETAYKEALAKEAERKGIAAKNAKAEFKKDDFLIRLLMKDPNNQLAWNGLVGENMTSTQIKEELRLEHLRQDNDNPQVDRGERIVVDGEVDRDGLTKKKKVARPKYENVAGTTGVTKVQVDKSLSINEQEDQIDAAKEEVNDRVWKVWDVIKDDIIPWTRDKNLSAKDLAEQQLRDTAKKWLRSNWAYFGAHPDQLAAFEKNPEQWVKTNITSKGIGSGG